MIDNKIATNDFVPFYPYFIKLYHCQCYKLGMTNDFLLKIIKLKQVSFFNIANNNNVDSILFVGVNVCGEQKLSLS